jgi:hypothetical protein
MKLRGWIFGTVLCLVLIKPLILILALGVPVFFADEWGLVPFIEKVWHGQSNFYDYWTALAEHRIFIPRLIFALMYHPACVDPRQVMIISWLIMSWIYALAIWYFLLKRVKLAGSAKFLYAFCFLSLGLSLVQYENWLWALQLDFFLTQVFVILATTLIGIDSIGNGTKSVLVALCAAGASMCTGQGMLLWLSGGFCVFLIARTWVSRSLLAFSFLCGMVLFVWFYHADGSGQLRQSSRLFWIFHNPLEALRSYFGLVGNPLTFCFGLARLKQAPIVGVAVAMLFACQVSVVLKRNLLQRSIPFILLGSFGFFYCGLVTLGRAGGGINEWFLTSRYATNSLSIPLALVGLSSVIAIFSRRADRSIKIDLLLCNVPLFLVLALSFASEVQAIDWARGDSSMRRFTTSLLPFFNLFDSATDGVPTGPFFSLCPVDNCKLINGAILPAVKVGFIPGPREVNVTPLECIGVQVETDVKRETVVYLSHHIDPRVVGGWVRIPERITPQAILLRKPGEEKFLTAARLEKEKGSPKGLSVYRWKLVILPKLDPDRGARFEAALLDEKEAILFPPRGGAEAGWSTQK